MMLTCTSTLYYYLQVLVFCPDKYIEFRDCGELSTGMSRFSNTNFIVIYSALINEPVKSTVGCSQSKPFAGNTID